MMVSRSKCTIIIISIKLITTRNRIIPTNTYLSGKVSFCYIKIISTTFKNYKPVTSTITRITESYNITCLSLPGIIEYCSVSRIIFSITILYEIGSVCTTLCTTVWGYFRSYISP